MVFTVYRVSLLVKKNHIHVHFSYFLKTVQFVIKHYCSIYCSVLKVETTLMYNTNRDTLQLVAPEGVCRVPAPPRGHRVHPVRVSERRQIERDHRAASVQPYHGYL